MTNKDSCCKPDPTRKLKSRILITEDLLIRLGACRTQIARFKEIFPKGVTLYHSLRQFNENNLSIAHENGLHVEWLLRRLHYTGLVPFSSSCGYPTYLLEGVPVADIIVGDGEITIRTAGKNVNIRFDDRFCPEVTLKDSDPVTFAYNVYPYTEDEYVEEEEEEEEEDTTQW